MVAALGALTALGPMSVDLYLPAFPAIARHFDTEVGSVQLSLATYLVGLAIGQVLWGRLSDIHGRRRPMLLGLALYLATSVALALAPSVEALIGLRLVQGFAGCAGIVISRAIVRDLYAGAEAARFFSSLLLVFGLAPVVAPLVGAQILALAGWQSVFVVLAVYATGCLAGVLWLPETLPAERRRPSGLRDAAASYTRVLRHRAFVAYALAGSLGSAAIVAYISASPAVLIEQHGVSPQAFGLVFGVNGLGFVLVLQVTGRVVVRHGPEAVLRWGVAGQSIAGVALLVVALTGGGLAAVLPAMFVVVASIGAIMPTSTALALTPFPDEAGAASAAKGTAQAALGAASGALVGSIALAPATAMGIVLTGACVLAIAVLAFAVPSRAPQPAAEPSG
jgi:DHA1 family bicyclomycin/chloramphenicol resistance-like MFS transporter